MPSVFISDQSTLDAWLAGGEPVALATVIRTWGSAPRPAGAKLAVSGRGIAGSVSAGCVEAAVIEAAGEVLADGRPRRLAFGVADETAWSVGLACGGEIEVWVERLVPALYRQLAAALDRDKTVAVATVVRGPEDVLGTRLVRVADDPRVLDCDMPPEVAEMAGAAAQAALRAGECDPLSLSSDIEIFVDVIRPLPTLAVVGAGHIATALVPMARLVGFRTAVIDPRAALLTAERFPAADRRLVTWPDAALAALPINESTAVAVLSHDPKLDDPALTVALTSPAFYVGALGSRRAQDQRRERLLRAGISEGQLARLRGPIGLDIGARSPEEIALAIMAEIAASRRLQGR